MALLLVVDQLWSVMGPVSIGHILVVSGGMAATETFDQVTTDHVPLSAVVMLQCIKPWCESQTICQTKPQSVHLLANIAPFLKLPSLWC